MLDKNDDKVWSSTYGGKEEEGSRLTVAIDVKAKLFACLLSPFLYKMNLENYS